MKLDEFHLERYWRYALPVAYAGFAASVAWGAALAVFELPDAPVAIDIILFVGALPLNVGSLLTARRLGEHDRPGPDRPVFAWIWQALLVGAVVLAAIRRRDLWAEDWTLMVTAAFFYGTAITTGQRHRRWRTVPMAAPPPVNSPVVASSYPCRPPAYLTAPPSQATGPTKAPLAPGADGPWATPVGLPRPPLPRLPRPVDVLGGLARLVPVLVGAGVLLVLIGRGEGVNSVAGPFDRPFYVATVVSGDRIAVAGPSEELPEPPAALRAAACRNYRDVLENRTLSPELAIVNDPGLLRSAELLDGVWASDSVAIDAETFLVQEGDVAGARARMANEDWPAADIDQADRYFAARSQQPTAGAADRYVVYTTSQTRSRRLIVRLAVEPDAELFTKPRYNRGGDLKIQMPDGSVTVVDESLCWR